MNYELMIIVPPLSTQEATTRLEELKTLVTKVGGKVDTATSWGERTLAYRIEKHTSGVYFLFNLTLPKDKVAALSLALSLREDVLRSMIVVKPIAPVVALKEAVKAVATPVLTTATKTTTDIEL